MSYDTEFGSEYAIEGPILEWFEANGWTDGSWHNNVCPSFHLNNPAHGEIWAEAFVDAQDENERECGPGPRFAITWYDDEQEPRERFEFDTFEELTAHIARVRETSNA